MTASHEIVKAISHRTMEPYGRRRFVRKLSSLAIELYCQAFAGCTDSETVADQTTSFGAATGIILNERPSFRHRSNTGDSRGSARNPARPQGEKPPPLARADGSAYLRVHASFC